MGLRSSNIWLAVVITSAALLSAEGTSNLACSPITRHAACYARQQDMQRLASSVHQQLTDHFTGNENQSYSLFKKARARIQVQLEKEILSTQQQNCTAIRLSGPMVDHHRSGSSSSSSNSRSSLADKHSRTTMLLVSDSWERVAMYLHNYSVNVLTYWNYANHWGYGLEVYVYERAMPRFMTGHFAKLPGIKAMFDLGYDYVLGLDWDMYITPSMAVPLSTFYDDWPSASILIQGETNMCTAAILYRNTPAGKKWLDYWWNMGVEGCCRTFTHDQLAFKHMINQYMRNFTGRSELYRNDTQQLLQQLKAGILPPMDVAAGKVTPGKGPGHEPHFLLEPPQQDVKTWIALKDSLRAAGSEFGFAGLEAHRFNDTSLKYLPGDNSSVALHSCHGIWWGCVPKNAPALLMHYSHRRTPDTNGFQWIAKKVLTALKAWGDLQGHMWDSSSAGVQPACQAWYGPDPVTARVAAAVVTEASQVVSQLV